MLRMLRFRVVAMLRHLFSKHLLPGECFCLISIKKTPHLRIHCVMKPAPMRLSMADKKNDPQRNDSNSWDATVTSRWLSVPSMVCFIVSNCRVTNVVFDITFGNGPVHRSQWIMFWNASCHPSKEILITLHFKFTERLGSPTIARSSMVSECSLLIIPNLVSWPTVIFAPYMGAPVFLSLWIRNIIRDFTSTTFQVNVRAKCRFCTWPILFSLIFFMLCLSA